MRKLGLLFTLILVLGPYFVYAQADKHVIMVSVDGLRPEFYLSNKWHAPNLKQLKKKGAFAEGVVSVFPSVTFPSHTTMVTGVSPAEHGIYYNAVFSYDSTNGGIYWNFKQIKKKTLWDVARKAGLKTAAIVWPVSAGAPVDYNIPDIGHMGNDVLEKYSYPSDFTATIKKEILGGVDKIDVGDDIAVAKIGAWVIKNAKPNLMTLHMFGLDHIEHANGREGEAVQRGLSKIDSSVGIIWNAVKEAGIEKNTLFLIVGDHGFYDTDISVRPNVILAKEGLIRDINKGDWDARFHTMGGSAFLFVKNNDPKIIGKVRDLFDKLPDSDKKYFRIIDPMKMKQVKADPNAVFALSALNNASFAATEKGDFITQRKKGGVHGHFPDTKEIQTGFIAVGKSVRSNANLKEMRLYDIAPIVLKYLNLSLGKLKGTIPEGLFKGDK
ncbi:alkaline phosphatase family protein [Niabella digestorum]|uniref:Ectonucleotide pyrophosphatase/phosphodiesterase n=1 Tax=Niabella digestorum TaxID=3117701 RepID=A0ABU7RFM9_9BACT